MATINEGLLRDMARSLCIRFGTTAPYAIGRISAERVGYAQIPCVRVNVWCRDEDLSALVPIVRQRVFGELAERGWGDEHILFVPSVRRGRVRMFFDENESSESCGRRKRGVEYTFHFEMRRALAAATFTSFGTYKPLPDARQLGA